jgi:hypothetical protein
MLRRGGLPSMGDCGEFLRSAGVPPLPSCQPFRVRPLCVEDGQGCRARALFQCSTKQGNAGLRGGASFIVRPPPREPYRCENCQKLGGVQAETTSVSSLPMLWKRCGCRLLK